MTERKDDWIPSFNGQQGDSYRRWKSHINWIKAGTQDDKLNLLAPKVIQHFKGEPAEYFMEKDTSVFRTSEGLDKLFAILDER